MTKAQQSERDDAHPRHAARLELPCLADRELTPVQLVAGTACWTGQDGDLIALNAAVSTPFEVHVDGKVVARGEPLIVEGKLAIRVTELADKDTASPTPLAPVRGDARGEVDVEEAPR